MGKESKERSRSQRNTAPYNVANSSFAKRLTSKVAEYIPSNWVSSWFDNPDAHEIDTSVPNNINSTRVQVEINNVESVSPNIKRSCISNHNNSVSNRTVYSSSKSQELGNETCSPILCSDKVPGPSGFNQQSQPTHKLFVASTPAFNPSKQLHTGGDNHSESGESTSGCSSLVSQSNKMRSDIELGKAKTLFLNRLITTEELPKTNKIGPQFDSTQFHSSSPGINRSKNMSLFYPGTIAYGGASTYRKSLGSNSSNITSPNVFKPSMKRVSLSNQSKGSLSTAAVPHMSAIAQNILKTINACTPVSRLSSLPTPEEANGMNSSLRGGGSGVKRKLPQLQIPTVVDLFALKRSERLAALSNSRQQNQSSSSSSSSSDEDDAQAITYTAKNSLQQKIKRARHEKSSKTQEVQTETENPNSVKLPNAVLNVPSLPIINIPVTPKRTKESSIDVELDISFSEPVNCKTLNLSNESSVLSIENEAANTSSANINFVYTSDASHAKPKPRASITLPPVDASPNKNSLLFFETKSSTTKESTLPTPSVQSTETVSNSQWKCTVCMMKHNASEVICKTCGQPKTNQQLESISAPVKTTQVPDLKVDQSTKSNASSWNNNLTITSTSNSLSESFKPAANTWECSECFVRNKAEADKCVCCTNPRPNDKCSKPTPVSSGPASKSLSTSTTVPPLVSSGFGDMFKKPSGNWECSVCMISNKSDDDKCVACETAKPGSKTEKPASSATDKTLSGPKFPFATSPGAPTFKFGLDKVDSKTSNENKTESSTSESIKTSSAPSFTFGMAVASSAQSTSVKPSAATFSFGIPKSDNSQPNSSSNSNSVAKVSESSAPVLNSSLVTNGKEEKPPVTSNLFSKSEPTTLFSNTGGNLFANVSSSPSNSKSSLPSINFTNTTMTTVTDSKTTTSTTPSFSFGNGPIAKVDIKSEIQSPETVKEVPKPSIFGSTLAFPQPSVTVPPLFGTSNQANSSESKELVNSFTSGSESPAKKINFGITAKEQVEQKGMPFLKPAVTPNIFGSKEPEKPKENVFTFGASSSINPPSMLNNDQGQNVNANQPPISAFPTKTDGFRMPCVESPNNNKVLSFGASSTIQQPPQAQASSPAFNFAAPNFTFGSNTSAPNFNSITGQQTQQPTNNIFGKPATNSGESMFGAGATGTVFGSNNTGFPAPSQPTASPACFQFGATVNTNSFSLNAQNSAPANSGYVFNAPATTPNFKPNFNFSGGAAPTFSAAPQPIQGGVANTAGRRFKKAVRRR